MTPEGALPPPRSGHAAAYDGTRQRMLVFGGIPAAVCDAQPANGTWALSLPPGMAAEATSAAAPAPSTAQRLELVGSTSPLSLTFRFSLPVVMKGCIGG